MAVVVIVAAAVMAKRVVVLTVARTERQMKTVAGAKEIETCVCVCVARLGQL